MASTIRQRQLNTISILPRIRLGKRLHRLNDRRTMRCDCAGIDTEFCVASGALVLAQLSVRRETHDQLRNAQRQAVVSFVPAPGMEGFPVRRDQRLHDCVVDEGWDTRLEQRSRRHLVRVAVPELLFFGRQVHEGIAGDDVLDAAELGGQIVRVIDDALDEVVADDGAVVVGLHLVRHLAVDEVEAIEE